MSAATAWNGNVASAARLLELSPRKLYIQQNSESIASYHYANSPQAKPNSIPGGIRTQGMTFVLYVCIYRIISDTSPFLNVISAETVALSHNLCAKTPSKYGDVCSTTYTLLRPPLQQNSTPSSSSVSLIL